MAHIMMQAGSILIYSNCQGIDLQRLARNISIYKGPYRFKLIQYHTLDLYEPWNSFPSDYLDDVIVLWEQVGNDFPQHRTRLRSSIPSHTQTVTFPPLTMLCLWPFTGADPRLVTDELYPVGRYPWTDTIAVEVAEALSKGPLRDKEIIDRYMAESASRMPNLERRLALDLLKWRARDAEANIQVARYLEENFRRQSLFHTYSRLTAEPSRYLLCELIKRTFALAGDAEEACEELEALSKRYVGYDLESCPIHPNVANEFKLTWHIPSTKYRHHSHMLSFEEYIVRYIRNLTFVR